MAFLGNFSSHFSGQPSHTVLALSSFFRRHTWARQSQQLGEQHIHTIHMKQTARLMITDHTFLIKSLKRKEFRRKDGGGGSQLHDLTAIKYLFCQNYEEEETEFQLNNFH